MSAQGSFCAVWSGNWGYRLSNFLLLCTKRGHVFCPLHVMEMVPIYGVSREIMKTGWIDPISSLLIVIYVIQGGVSALKAGLN